LGSGEEGAAGRGWAPRRVSVPRPPAPAPGPEPTRPERPRPVVPSPHARARAHGTHTVHTPNRHPTATHRPSSASTFPLPSSPAWCCSCCCSDAGCSDRRRLFRRPPRRARRPECPGARGGGAAAVGRLGSARPGAGASRRLRRACALFDRPPIPLSLASVVDPQTPALAVLPAPAASSPRPVPAPHAGVPHWRRRLSAAPRACPRGAKRPPPRALAAACWTRGPRRGAPPARREATQAAARPACVPPAAPSNAQNAHRLCLRVTLAGLAGGRSAAQERPEDSVGGRAGLKAWAAWGRRGVSRRGERGTGGGPACAVVVAGGLHECPERAFTRRGGGEACVCRGGGGPSHVVAARGLCMSWAQAGLHMS
jgi:hypothetical protein